MNPRLIVWAALGFAFNLGFSRLSYGLLLPALRHDFAAPYSVFGLVYTANLVGYFLEPLGRRLCSSRSAARSRSTP
jgi:fucose permease